MGRRLMFVRDVNVPPGALPVVDSMDGTSGEKLSEKSTKTIKICECYILINNHMSINTNGPRKRSFYSMLY